MVHVLILFLLPIIIGGFVFSRANRKQLYWERQNADVGFQGYKSTSEFVLGFAFCFAISEAVLAIGWQVAKASTFSDTQHLNGRITGKDHGSMSCCHCHDECVTRNNKGSCTHSRKVCSHSHDYYSNISTTVGAIEIESCASHSWPPDVWVRAHVGEPATVENSYQNYLKGDTESLLSKHVEVRDQMPKFPEVYDHYKVDHVIGNIPSPPTWQPFFRELNADLGAILQIDINVVLTGSVDPYYAQEIEAAWLYGPKNSFNIVMGVTEGTIRWVRFSTLSEVEMLKIRLRDALQGMQLDDPAVLETIKSEIRANFKRTPMAKFEYLADGATPGGVALVLLYLGVLAVSVGSALFVRSRL